METKCRSGCVREMFAFVCSQLSKEAKPQVLRESRHSPDTSKNDCSITMIHVYKALIDYGGNLVYYTITSRTAYKVRHATCCQLCVWVGLLQTNHCITCI